MTSIKRNKLIVGAAALLFAGSILISEVASGDNNADQQAQQPVVAQQVNLAACPNVLGEAERARLWLQDYNDRPAQYRNGKLPFDHIDGPVNAAHAGKVKQYIKDSEKAYRQYCR